MKTFFQKVFPCIPIGPGSERTHVPKDSQKHDYYTDKLATTSTSSIDEKDEKPHLTANEAATSIVNALFEAENPNTAVTDDIKSIVHQAGGWSEYLAKKIINALESALKTAKAMNKAMSEAYDKVLEAARKIEGFAADHPVATGVFLTVIALGILVVLAPYVLEWIGFAELGPVEGSWAAGWQSTYGGLVPKRALFTYFQRLGMVWKH